MNFQYVGMEGRTIVGRLVRNYASTDELFSAWERFERNMQTRQARQLPRKQVRRYCERLRRSHGR